MRCVLTALAIMVIAQPIWAQHIENVIVEEYYVFSKADASKTEFPEGTKTYRIYLDLAPNVRLQAVYGQEGHELLISTSTSFYNSANGGGRGSLLKRGDFEHAVELMDSYVTVGAASMDRLGVPVAIDDSDSELLKSKKKGLIGIRSGKQLWQSDGLIEGELPSLSEFGLVTDAMLFGSNEKVISSTNGAWAVFGGHMGSTEENMILIAQLTTDGDVAFKLNIQVGDSDGNSYRYVANNPNTSEKSMDCLIYPRENTNGQ